jgi:hypothetical protein
MQSESHKARISILNYTGVPLHQLSQFLSMADVAVPGDLKAPIACQLARPGGPAAKTQQALAQLMNEDSDLLCFLQARNDAEEGPLSLWWDKWAVQSHVAIQNHGAELFTRVEHACSSFPLALFALDESSLPQFLSTPSCCLDECGSRRVRDWCRAADDEASSALTLRTANIRGMVASSVATHV